MKKIWVLLALCIAAAPSVGRAAAIDFVASGCASADGGTWICNGNLVEDFSGAGLVSYDLELNNTNPVSLTVDLAPGEQTVVWNALYFDDVFTANLDRYDVSLSGATIALQGSVSDDFGAEVTDVTVTGGGAFVGIDFDPFTTNFDVGDASGLGGYRQDWQLDAASAGGSFTLTMTPTLVPEPDSGALALLGLLGLGALRRSGRR